MERGGRILPMKSKAVQVEKADQVSHAKVNKQVAGTAAYLIKSVEAEGSTHMDLFGIPVAPNCLKSSKSPWTRYASDSLSSSPGH
ncbi:hypothetical protein RRG08_012973 [Elysia crispata]|uniref:Uncharacterized protein n=1 Tax=Elysia crispata TaxID=231223 RepID=A0AAE0ZZZ4_9GAST|nr:hypothetical protein RRG08_012973 [Elysia crispata]